MEREIPVTEGVGAATPAPTQPQLVTARQHETLGPVIQDYVTQLQGNGLPAAGPGLYTIEAFVRQCDRFRVPVESVLTDPEFDQTMEKMERIKDRYLAHLNAGGHAPRLDAVRPSGAAAGAAGNFSTPPSIPKKRPAAAEPDESSGDSLTAFEKASLQGAKVQSVLLEGKPLYVELFSPILSKHCRALRTAIGAISALSRELLQFSGSLADLKAADFESAEIGAVLAGDTDSAEIEDLQGTLFSKLDACRTAVKALGETGMRVQRIWWLAEFTHACNWETVLSLIHREDQDATGLDLDPDQTPLTTWEDKVKAAIIGANQQKMGLTKDGKNLVGPIHPRLLHLHGQAHLDRVAKAGMGAPSSTGAAQGGAVGPPGSVYGRGHPTWRPNGNRTRPRGGRGRGGGNHANRENSQPNQAAVGAPAVAKKGKKRGGK